MIALNCECVDELNSEKIYLIHSASLMLKHKNKLHFECIHELISKKTILYINSHAQQ